MATAVAYCETPVWQDGKKVTALQIVGLSTELLLKTSCSRGINTVGVADVVSSVDLNHVEFQGRHRKQLAVALTAEDKELTVKVAKEVRRVLFLHGFNVLKAVQKEGSAGTHDIICDRPCPGALDVPGLYSVELKLRRILSDSGRSRLRQQLQRAALPLLDKAVQRTRPGTWAGRLVLLVEFGPGGLASWRAIRCDWCRDSSEQWQGLFGWAGSRDPAALVAPQAAPPRVPEAARPDAAKSFKNVLAELKGAWVKVGGADMASIKELLKAMSTSKAKRAMPTVGERFEGWRRKRKWTTGQWDRAPRKGAKPGGALGYFATKEVLKDIYDMHS